MTATATFLNTVFKRHRIQVEFPIHHRYTVPMEQTTINATETPDVYDYGEGAVVETKAQRIQHLLDLYESSVKAWAEFPTPDTTRDGAVLSETWTRNVDGWDFYDLVLSWTITATARLFIEIDTEYDPESPEAIGLFQAAANDAADAWINIRPFEALP